MIRVVRQRQIPGADNGVSFLEGYERPSVNRPELPDTTSVRDYEGRVAAWLRQF